MARSCKMKSAWAVLAALLCFWVMPSVAQTDDAEQEASADETQPPPERVRTFLEERAVTRPQVAPPRIGVLPRRIAAADIDWAEVARLEAETRQRDVRSNRLSTAIISRDPAGLRRVLPENLPRVRPLEVSRVVVPVLIPATSEVSASVVVYGQPDAYTANARAGEGVDLRISGTRKKLVLPDREDARRRIERLRAKRPSLPNLDTEYVIARSELSTDLSFSRFGAGYVLSLMCDDQQSDSRCAEDEFIVSLASSLLVLNEAPAADEGGDND